MPTTLQTRVVALMVVVVAAMGAIDALIAGQADMAAILGMLVALGLVLVARTSGRRRHVAIRADLARWLDQRAAVSGERVDDLADRAIAAYRAGIVGDERDG